MFKATVTVRLRPSILDPQGKAVHHALQNLGYAAVTQVRIGKVIDLWIDADSAETAERIAREAAEKLLANPVMEDFDVTVTQVTTPVSAT
ncbi:MAG: phosphoribosylformylglycinamidine synthase subunit PurS [Rhodothermus sp.]|nr:phosphoribosylformylglycinamidine synthase subunit PurS [Rhodothermus sp.]